VGLQAVGEAVGVEHLQGEGRSAARRSSMPRTSSRRRAVPTSPRAEMAGATPASSSGRILASSVRAGPTNDSSCPGLVSRTSDLSASASGPNGSPSPPSSMQLPTRTRAPRTRARPCHARLLKAWRAMRCRAARPDVGSTAEAVPPPWPTASLSRARSGYGQPDRGRAASRGTAPSEHAGGASPARASSSHGRRDRPPR